MGAMARLSTCEKKTSALMSPAASIDVHDQVDAADKKPGNWTGCSNVRIRTAPGDYVLQRYASMCHQAGVLHQ